MLRYTDPAWIESVSTFVYARWVSPLRSPILG